mmetsp:Transcript_3896/g.7182  ORF Transcript_3896/g.7182 Transcript_3896/m.7182 type:complete len:509 (+) Transcript_3896:138-1664(+)|eukprot:CAMPEP_0197538384 /NCGR_PEP_ID=MMETSP1318-20131121/59617_1 /TAXON_ID=552666 /ORGANISM="Partenskyella glossopodia, Strain RCC365" /LENGTH=508 /DNA_ID=CAMNT_0043096783 /DNA_START=32 /DNA_END=1558 /DNA_ORIENTATION=-
MNEWACPKCTLLNPIVTSKCNACGQTRPVLGTTGSGVGGNKAGWVCPTCTFENKTGSSSCKMCGTQKITKEMSEQQSRLHIIEAKAQQLSRYAEAQSTQAHQRKNRVKEGGERNWLIHKLYVRRQFDACLREIEERIQNCGPAKGSCEFALYVKALILRHQGKIEESLNLFQLTTKINPQNIANIKQVARSLYLLGKKHAALDIYRDALTIDKRDWEVYHNLGLCHMELKEYPKAIESFESANAIQAHDSTYMQIGKILVLQNKYEEAVEIYEEALENSPENAELLTTLGLLFLRIGENYKAFKNLRTSLSIDPRNVKTILASGSIIQDHNDNDVALIRYRVAALQTPNSAQLWNNIGMCFFGKGLHVASISCLKRALYLDPFEWIISYNLGLVHLCAGQYASAFHFLSASINLKPDFPPAYMYLGMILSKLDDFDNARSAYIRAIEMESDHLFHLNFSIMLYNNDHTKEARKHYKIAVELFEGLDEATKKSDPDVSNRIEALQRVLG